MAMKKFIKKNWIVLSALVVVVLIIFILLISGKPSVTYKLNPQEALIALSDTSVFVSPADVFNKKDKTAILVDVRNSDEFTRGHIENAVNVPVLELFSSRSLRFFKDLAKSGQQAILYGNNQLQANSPWLLLKQTGIENVKVMQGGYDFYKMLPVNDSLLKTGNLCWKNEIPVIDTAEFNKKAAEPTEPVAVKKPVKVIPVKKETSSGGGC